MTAITLPDSPEDVKLAQSQRLAAGVDHAWRSPFFAAKLRSAGLEPGGVPTPDQWLTIEPTTKEELRQFSSAEFYRQLVVAPRRDIAMYWRSGGVTGRPMFYPKSRGDMDALVESFARVLDITGLRPGDVVHNSFPYVGGHPIGHMFGFALRERECGNIWVGAGSNTPTDDQVKLLFELGPTGWMGIGSYINHLGHRAEALGYDPASSSLRTIISSAEPLTPAKRERMQRVWDAELFDSYGMTECSMMGAECDKHDGLHLWTDMFRVEILAPETGEPVPDGETGAVVVTPLHSMSAIPFIRWWSGDIGSLESECRCAWRAYPRLKLGGRTVGFSKIRGVNINHNDFEDLLLTLPEVADYMVTLSTRKTNDTIEIELETQHGADPASVASTVENAVVRAFEIRAETRCLGRGSIASRLEGQVKQVRFRDQRQQ